MRGTHRYRIAVMTAGMTWSAWQLAALRDLIASGDVDVVALVDLASKRRDAASEITAGELPANPLAAVSAAADLRDVPRLHWNGETAQRLADDGVDLIWSTGRAIVPRGFEYSTPAGIWTLEVDDGDPACVAALLRARPMIPVRLLRLDAGRAQVLAEGRFLNEPFSPALTRIRVLYGCCGWPARQLRAWMMQGDAALTGEDVQLPTSREPPLLARAALPLRQIVSLAKRAWECCYREKWTVARIDKPITAFLEDIGPAEFSWLEEAPDNDFYADAFGRETRSGLFLLAEAYDGRRGAGRIDALELQPADGSCVKVWRNVLPADCHLSYPFLIQEGDAVYCVPESHQSGRITLYRADVFPRLWRPVATLVDNFHGIDPTIFRHEGRWWLLCGNKSDEPNAKLYGFFADALTGPWQPHPLNPLKCDPSCSRPGGTPFQHDGRLYRPAQDCSTAYGAAVSINRVDVLSPSAFSEVCVRRVSPDPRGRYSDGLHTLASAGPRCTLVDGKRLIFAPLSILTPARHFFRRLGQLRAGTGSARSQPIRTRPPA